MAFLNLEEDKDELNGQPTTSPQGSLIGGGGQKTVAGAVTNPSQNTPDKPGNFVGIKTYLDANKQQAQKLGDNAASVITNSANEARQGLGNLQGQFNQKAVGVGSDEAALGQLNQAEKLNDSQKQTLKNQFNAQYTGPQALTDLSDDYSKVGSQVNKAFQNISGSGTEEGRTGLIKQINDKPRTTGINTFDNALLSSGGGRQKLAEAAGANKDINDQTLSNANAAAVQKAQEAKTLTDQTRQQTQSAVLGAQGNLNQTLEQKVAQKQAEQESLKSSIESALKAGKLTIPQVEALGLDPNMKTYGLDLKKYAGNLTPSDIDVTKADVAGDDEAARLAALYDLSGQAAPSLGKKEGRFGVNLGYDLAPDIQSQKDSLFRKIDDGLAQGGTSLVDVARDPKTVKDAFGYISAMNGYGQNGSLAKQTQGIRDELSAALKSGDDAKAFEAKKKLADYIAAANKGALNRHGEWEQETKHYLSLPFVKQYLDMLNSDQVWNQQLAQGLK